MKITLYELIGFMKDDKAPYRIDYENTLWEYDKDDNDYYSISKNVLLFKEYLKDICIDDLDEMIKILPEENDEWQDIEEINHNGKQIYNPKTSAYNTLNSKEKNIFIPVINKLIKNQKYLKEKLEDKDE